MSKGFRPCFGILFLFVFCFLFANASVCEWFSCLPEFEIILFVGTIDSWPSVDCLGELFHQIEAYGATLSTNCLGFFCVTIGDGGGSECLRRLVERGRMDVLIINE